MSHSAAHHQGDNPLITAYFPDSIPAAPPAAHLTSDSPPLSPTQRHPHGVESSPPSDRDSGYDTLHPQPSDSHTQQYHHPSRRRSIPSPHQGSVDTGYPSSAEPIIVPETVVAASHLENGSLVTRASMTSEAVRKEGRGRGSWTDHSSYMSGDNHMNGAARVHKRAIVEDITPEEEEPDALLMLVRLLPSRWFVVSWRKPWLTASLCAVPTLHPCSCLLLYRIPVYRLRSSLRPPRFPAPPLFLHSIPAKYVFPCPTMRPSSTAVTHPRAVGLPATVVEAIGIHATDL